MPTEPSHPSPVVTLRSVLIGLAGVCFVCGLVPYNDFVMENTFLIGNFLPIGLLLIVLLLVIGVNVPLLRYAPSWALRQGELAVVVLMVLVACSVPASGLMRYLPSSMVAIHIGAAEKPTEWGTAVDAAHLPTWLLPTVDGNTAAEKGSREVYTQFRARAPGGVVPWSAWLRPAISWGVLVAMLWGLLISLSLIVRKQWTENERLSFPLATIYQSLIEPPAPGRLLGPLFRSSGFWISAGSVFAIHGLNAMHSYNGNWPFVPLGYDFRDMLVDPPWSFTHVCFKTAGLTFSMIGIAFFIQTKTAFSLWAFFVLSQIAEMTFGTLQLPLTDTMRQDQTFGGVVVFAAVILYVGRRHWWMIIRHMVGRRRHGESDGLYLSYTVTGWAAATFFLGIISWLWLAGVSIGAGVAITVTLVLLFMVVARVLADTGLIFVQISYPLMRTFYYPALVPPTPLYTSQTNFFFAGWFTELFHDTREALIGFFQMGVRVADESIDRGTRTRRTGIALLASVALALGVGYVVSWTSMLKAEYAYAQTTSSTSITPNVYGVEDAPRGNILNPSVAYMNRNVSPESLTPLGNPLLQLGVGATIVGACSTLRLIFSWWPLQPVGFIVLYSFAIQKIWLSLFVGWVVKVAVMRLGGASLLKAGRPVFIGLIIGESFAAAFWLVVSVVLHQYGFEYKSFLFLPG